MNVTQLINSRGNAVKNQFIITEGETVTFQSYDTKICRYNKQDKTLFLFSNHWDCSNTTRKHFAQFVNDFTCFGYDTKPQFLKLINEGMTDRIKTIS